MGACRQAIRSLIHLHVWMNGLTLAGSTSACVGRKIMFCLSTFFSGYCTISAFTKLRTVHGSSLCACCKAWDDSSIIFFFLLRLVTSYTYKYYILVKELKVERVHWSIPIVNVSRKSQTDLSKRELLIQKDDWLYVKGNEDVAFQFDYEVADSTAQLDDVQLGLLEAIPTPNGRFTVFVTTGWLDWGAYIKTGDTCSVYIRVPMKDGSECCSTARVHYIGRLTEDQPGTMFGVEITVS